MREPGIAHLRKNWLLGQSLGSVLAEFSPNEFAAVSQPLGCRFCAMAAMNGGESGKAWQACCTKLDGMEGVCLSAMNRYKAVPCHNDKKKSKNLSTV